MRLIDADALKSWIDCGHQRPPTELCFSELDVVRILDKQPTIDAVQVIRCKECKYRKTSTCPMLQMECGWEWDGCDVEYVDRTTDDGFCSLGKLMGY